MKVIESDQKGDGKLDTWEYFEKDTLDRIGRDTDADGKVDVWERAAPALTEEEEAKAAEAAEAAKPEKASEAAADEEPKTE